MPLPLAALGVQAGLTGLGLAANSLFNDRPEVPDLTAERLAEFDRRRARLSQAMQRRQDDLEGDLAAAGVTGSGGVAAREALYRQTGAARADLAAQEADAVRRAENQEALMRYQGDMGQYQNRAQGISDLVGQGGRLLGQHLMMRRYGYDPLSLSERAAQYPNVPGQYLTDPGSYTTPIMDRPVLGQ